MGTRKISNNLTLHLKQLEKEEQRKPSVNRRKEIIKIRAEINEIETKRIIAKINVTKTWIFGNITKVDKPLTRIKEKMEMALIKKIKNENKVTTDTTEIKKGL